MLGEVDEEILYEMTTELQVSISRSRRSVPLPCELYFSKTI